jgi:hypothetical protein
MGLIESISTQLLALYSGVNSLLPAWGQNFLNLFLMALLIVLYSIFVWKFYRFIATKNIISLDLKRYNRANHPLIIKVFAGVLYFIEYIIVLPFIIFFWFAIFTVFLLLLTENHNLNNIIIISATMIMAIRMVSYYKEDLAKELAKMLPFMLLAVSFLNPNFFDVERIFSGLIELSNSFGKIIHYLTFIISLEIILRFFDFIFSLFGLDNMVEEEKKE